MHPVRRISVKTLINNTFFLYEGAAREMTIFFTIDSFSMELQYCQIVMNKEKKTFISLRRRRDFRDQNSVFSSSSSSFFKSKKSLKVPYFAYDY